jgi:hypothetical protein
VKKVRIVLESPVLGRMYRTVDTATALRGVAWEVQKALDFFAAGDKCASFTVSVHVDGEGCDHE